jgi:fucose permease
MAVGRFGGDWAQARLGRNGLHRVATTMAVVGMTVAALVPDRWIAVAGYTVAGGGIATFFPRIYDDAARLPGRRGAGLGAMTAGSRLAGFIAPSIVGAVAATSLSVGDAVAIVSLPCFVGFVLVTASGPSARTADSTKRRRVRRSLRTPHRRPPSPRRPP